MARCTTSPLFSLTVRDADRTGVRERIYRALVAAILDGRLAAGSRLPSSRDLAVDWSVARNTVDDALSQLQSEGMVVRRVGDGTFVAPGVVVRPRASATRRRAPAALGRRALRAASARGTSAAREFTSTSIPRAVAFVAGLPALDAFPLALWRRLAARRLRLSGAALLGYLPASGYPPLQAAIADHLATARGIRCAPAQVMVLSSSMQAIDLVARVLAERNDGAWVEAPCYPNLRAVLAMAGVDATAVDTDGEGIDPEAGLRQRRRPTLICVTPSCVYPTGAVLTLPRRSNLLRIAAEAGAWLVEDDHQNEFAWTARPVAPLFALDDGARTLYVNTFSLTTFPSLRLAYVVLPPSLVDVFHAVRRQLDDHTHGFMQAVLADFIAGGHFSAHLRRMRALYASRRCALIDACARDLPGLRLGALDCGLNAVLALPPSIDDRAMSRRAAAEGLRVLPLSRYDPASRRRSNGLLLGYAGLPERRIAAAIGRLARVLS